MEEGGKKMTRNPETQYQILKGTIKGKIKDIEKSLGEHEKRFYSNPPNLRGWGYPGDLSHIVHELDAIQRFLSNS